MLISLGYAFLEMLLIILIFARAGKYLATDVSRTIIGIIEGIILVYLGFEMEKDVCPNKISLEIKKSKDEKRGNMFLAGAVLSTINYYFII